MQIFIAIPKYKNGRAAELLTQTFSSEQKADMYLTRLAQKGFWNIKGGTILRRYLDNT